MLTNYENLKNELYQVVTEATRLEINGEYEQAEKLLGKLSQYVTGYLSATSERLSYSAAALRVYRKSLEDVERHKSI